MATVSNTDVQPLIQEPSKRSRLIGHILGGVVILFLIFDGAIKLAPIQPVTDSLQALGWPNDDGTARFLGIITLIITALYALPRTAILGAILMTAYLGGAIATHARIDSPLFSHTLFGVYVGLIAWTALWLRNPRLRALFV